MQTLVPVNACSMLQRGTLLTSGKYRSPDRDRQDAEEYKA